ncbi:porin family protein [Echinimonas agarilytica]|uniref:Porin family protein n=1 Tax=Echinimonas agarilytica TaxID=1215918 RepID=A0AA42B8J0_9GAMM|nr:porin family protein [Echinimonas agarilytica]MCM2680932.1 porin family protein [Echinimonas agarilytica]
MVTLRKSLTFITALCIWFTPATASAVSLDDLELFVDAGINYHLIDLNTGTAALDNPSNETGVSYHFGAGARKQFGESGRHFVGSRIEIDEMGDDFMFALRAIDYQYSLDHNWRVGAFIGAVSWRTGASQTGYHFGGGVSYIDLWPNVDLSLEFRFEDSLERDRLLDGDPPPDYKPGQTSTMANIYAGNLFLSYRF